MHHVTLLLTMIVPAVLALSPASLVGRSNSGSCLSTQQVCGNGCIAFVDICCPVAPNGQQGSCGGTQNCWFAPDGSPACCDLFENCAGSSASSLPRPSTISVESVTVQTTAPSVTAVPTVVPPAPVSSSSATSTSVIPPPAVSSPAAVSSSSASASKVVLTVTRTTVATVPCSSSVTVATSSHPVIPPSSTVSTTPSPVYTGAATANRWSVASLVGAALVAGRFVF